VLTLALFQQLRGVESERSFLRDVDRFCCHLFPGVVGLALSSFHRRVRKLRRYFELLRRAVLPELVGAPETMIVDSTLVPSFTRAKRSNLRVFRERPGPGGVPSASTGSSCISSARPAVGPSPTSLPPPTAWRSAWPRNCSPK
jgi:hypothetical protein